MFPFFIRKLDQYAYLNYWKFVDILIGIFYVTYEQLFSAASREKPTILAWLYVIGLNSLLEN